MKKVLALSLLGLMGPAVGFSQSSTATYTFCQGGYSEGAVLSGTFTGGDVDTVDGQIVYFGGGGELTDFTATFSGNSLVGAVSFTFADLLGFVYDDDGGPLGDGTTGDVEGIAANNAGGDFIAGPGPNAICGIGVDCASIGDSIGTDVSQELIVINGGSCPAVQPTPVPVLPMGALWLLAGLAGFLGIRQLRQAAS